MLIIDIQRLGYYIVPHRKKVPPKLPKRIISLGVKFGVKCDSLSKRMVPPTIPILSSSGSPGSRVGGGAIKSAGYPSAGIWMDGTGIGESRRI